MRLKDITEAKKEPIKARDPNWRDMEALRKSGAAGSHGDKTKTIPRKEKYKKISLEDQFQAYIQEEDDDYGYTWNCKKCGAENEFRMTPQEKQEYIDDWEADNQDLVADGETGEGALDNLLLDQGEESGFHYGDKCKNCGTIAENPYGEDVNEADPDTLGKMNDKMRDVLSKVDTDDKAQAQATKDKAEADRQAKANELGDEGMKKYIDMLKSHDWTYQYSDDHSVWQRGSAEADKIRRLGDIVDPDRKLYKQHSPFYEAIANERSLTKGEEKDKEKYVKGMKKNKKDFKKRYGDDAEAVMYATATKMAKESSDIFKALQQVEETATAGATSAGNIATVASPHMAIGDKKTRKKYGLTGGLPNPPKAKAQKPTDNALDMKGTSIFGGPLKRS